MDTATASCARPLFWINTSTVTHTHTHTHTRTHTHTDCVLPLNDETLGNRASCIECHHTSYVITYPHAPLPCRHGPYQLTPPLHMCSQGSACDCSNGMLNQIVTLSQFESRSTPTRHTLIHPTTDLHTTKCETTAMTHDRRTSLPTRGDATATPCRARVRDPLGTLHPWGQTLPSWPQVG